MECTRQRKVLLRDAITLVRLESVLRPTAHVARPVRIYANQFMWQFGVAAIDSIFLLNTGSYVLSICWGEAFIQERSDLRRIRWPALIGVA